MKKCLSCNKEVTNDYVDFKCPVCKASIIRCQKCRENNIGYTCKCGFRGP